MLCLNGKVAGIEPCQFQCFSLHLRPRPNFSTRYMMYPLH